jgi:hypothetical protein
MTPIDQLYLVAEIAAAILGFIAVFIALSKENGRFSESDRHFIQALVLSSILAIVLALTPSSLRLFFSEEVVWQYSVYLSIALGSIVSILMAWEQLHMSTTETRSVNWLWHVPPWGMAIAVMTSLAFAVVQDANYVEAFVISATLMIPLSLWCFTAIVFRKFF